MSFWRTLSAPWFLMPRYRRWLFGTPVAVFLALVILIILISSGRHNDPDGMMGAVAMIAIVVIGLWVIVVPQLLRATRLARHLRIPHLHREAAGSLGLYVLLSVVVPAVLLGATGLEIVTTALVLGLAAAAGFLYALLPMSLVGILILSLFIGPMLLDVAAPGHVGFAQWSAPVLFAMTVVAIIRWRQMQKLNLSNVAGMRRSLFLYFNRDLAGNGQFDARGNPAGFLNSSNVLRQQPDRMLPRADLSCTGPGSSEASLRVALGLVYTPRTWRERMRLLYATRWSLIIMFGVAAFSLIALRNIVIPLFTAHHFVFSKFLVVEMVVIMAVFRHLHLNRTWRQTNTELPLLALLPGLGNAHAVKRELFKIILKPAIRITVVTFFMLLGLVFYTNSSPAVALCLLLIPPMWNGVLAAGVLSTLGGPTRRDRRIMNWGIYPASFVISCVVILVPNAPIGTSVEPLMQRMTSWILLVWAALALALVVMGRRGWWHLRDRPHVFLMNCDHPPHDAPIR